MTISHNGLRKLLIDKTMKKGDMMNFVGISNSIAAKMTNKEPVSINVLEKVCEKLDCDFGNIVHYEKEKKAVYNSGIQCRACIKAVLASRIQKDGKLYFAKTA